MGNAEDKFVRKRLENGAVSPSFSEDSEISDTESFTHKTWPKRGDWNSPSKAPPPPKREVSQIKKPKRKKRKKPKPPAKKKRMITSTTASASTDQSTELSDLTVENLKKLQFQKSRRNSMPYTFKMGDDEDEKKNEKSPNRKQSA